jgi:hypothetical protein
VVAEVVVMSWLKLRTNMAEMVAEASEAFTLSDTIAVLDCNLKPWLRSRTYILFLSIFLGACLTNQNFLIGFRKFGKWLVTFSFLDCCNWKFATCTIINNRKSWLWKKLSRNLKVKFTVLWFIIFFEWEMYHRMQISLLSLISKLNL